MQTKVENTLITYTSINNDTLTLLHHPDGSSFIPTSSTKESKGIIDNQDIEWEDFCIAAPQMIRAMVRANWPHDHIQMMANFWTNPQQHPFHSSGTPFKQQLLLLYQAEQRMLWHITIVNPHARFNLSIIHEALLRDTKEQLFWEDSSQMEVEWNSLVSLSQFFSMVTLTNCPVSFPSYAASCLAKCMLPPLPFFLCTCHTYCWLHAFSLCSMLPQLSHCPQAGNMHDS